MLPGVALDGGSAMPAVAVPRPSAVALWDRYRSVDPHAPGEPPPAEHFCDNEHDADLCVELILTGRKRATASALAAYRHAGEALPQPGKLLIVTNWAGEAKALIRTVRVTTCRFGDVPASFARLEGEGDGTLAWWRDAHRAFWQRTLPDRVVDDDLSVVCEEFEVVLMA